MPNNDSISRASVLEALSEYLVSEIRKDASGEYQNWFVTAYKIVESIPAVTDSLSAELESLPKNKRYVIDCKSNNSYVAFSHDFPRGGGNLVSGHGKTPLAAVRALKEQLDFDRHVLSACVKTGWEEPSKEALNSQ